jgi:hypothetical protein
LNKIFNREIRQIREKTGKTINHRDHRDHKEKCLLLAPVYVLFVLYVVKSLPYLLVDRVGRARHYPGMARKSTDEAWLPLDG